MTGGSGRPVPPPPPPPVPPPPPPQKQTCVTITTPGDNEDPLAAVAFRAARASWYHRLIVHLNETSPLIQEGPTCGLAAAAMALDQLGRRGDDVSVTSLLEEARRGGMTAQGEMFSAADLARLAVDRLSSGSGGHLTAGWTACVRRDLDRPEAVVRAVLGGDAVLVPYPLESYDADRNHEPCERGGAAAHWALVCGLLLGTAADADDPRETDRRPLTADEAVFPPPPQLVSPAAARAAGLQPEPQELLLLCRQSKSRRLAVWRHGQLARSNGQLRTARRPRPGERPYVLSQGSVEAGLCGQWVQLSGRTDGRDHPLADWLLSQETADTDHGQRQ